MGLLNKRLYEVAVRFSGVAETAAQLDSESVDDLSDLPLSAWMDSNGVPEVAGRSALVPLIPLVAVRHLANTASARQYTQPLMWSIREAARDALDSEEKARQFRFAAFREEFQFDAADLGQAAFYAGMPHLLKTPPASAESQFRAFLMAGRGGRLWAKVKAPLRGGPAFATYGLMAMIDSVLDNGSYDDDVVPAMAGVMALCEAYYTALDQERWEGMQAMMVFQNLVTSVALSEDPAAAVAPLREAARNADEDAALSWFESWATRTPPTA